MSGMTIDLQAIFSWVGGGEEWLESFHRAESYAGKNKYVNAFPACNIWGLMPQYGLDVQGGCTSLRVKGSD